MSWEIYAVGIETPQMVRFVMVEGADQLSRSGRAEAEAEMIFSVSADVVQSASDSWGWTTHVPDGENEKRN